MINNLRKLLSVRNHDTIKKKISSMHRDLSDKKHTGGGDHLLAELKQIHDAHTINRAQYYIRRLIKGLTVVKLGKLNDLNLNRWKEYGDILTDSLWLLEKRDRSGVHTAEYWGNFIPQIPNQLLRRFTKQDEWVLDPFLGSGTTLIECKKLGRNGIGIELQSSVSMKTRRRIEKEDNPFSVTTKTITGDSAKLDLRKHLQVMNILSVQFAILHPPYWDIIQFSKNKNDLSNAATLQKFISSFGQVVDRVNTVLDPGRYLAVIIGDKYRCGEWIPLGFLTMQEVIKREYTLKSIIVKNFKETKGKRTQEELWRYRALAGGFYVFKHEYIFLMQKKR